MPDPLISIIVPCLDDAQALSACLDRLADAGTDVEIIVADASAADSCREIATRRGATVVHCTKRGRGSQMNEGAAVARGEILLFSHADTELEARHIAAVRMLADSTRAFSAGAFYKDIPAQYPRAAWASGFLRWYLRHFGVIYGDQSLFLRREHFVKIGRFADIPIMEDVEITRRLRRAGGLVFVDPPLRASMRRFQKRGIFKTKVQNILLVLLFRLGVSPGAIYRWYYGKKS
jgi:rSAM/selenodomain-associated transferase 2